MARVAVRVTTPYVPVVTGVKMREAELTTPYVPVVTIPASCYALGERRRELLKQLS